MIYKYTIDNDERYEDLVCYSLYSTTKFDKDEFLQIIKDAYNALKNSTDGLDDNFHAVEEIHEFILENDDRFFNINSEHIGFIRDFCCNDEIRRIGLYQCGYYYYGKEEETNDIIKIIEEVLKDYKDSEFSSLALTKDGFDNNEAEIFSTPRCIRDYDVNYYEDISEVYDLYDDLKDELHRYPVKIILNEIKETSNL